jgi:hypothetical protein
VSIEPATILPSIAAAMLKKAAETPIPFADSLARRKAVDQAIERVKREYPSYFRQDADHAENNGGGK